MNLALSPELEIPTGVACHREMPWISLSPSAEVPLDGATIAERERERLLQDMMECQRSVPESFIQRRAATAGGGIDPHEVVAGWRKFFLGHYAFFFAFGLLSDRYRQGAAALERGGWPLAEIEQACALWRLAAALFLYGVDFTPTEAIYQG